MDLPGAKKGDYLTDRLTEEGLKIIETHARRKKPFFLYQSYHSVHTPIQGRPDYVRAQQQRAAADGLKFNAKYAAMIQSLDEGVGRIVAKLETLGISDNTALIFFSDNGGFSHCRGKKNNITDNSPLRRGKGYCYEGGHREPCIIFYPPLVKAGGVCGTPIISTDFYPTILELGGAAPLQEQHVDGLSILPLLKDPAATLARTGLYWHYPHNSPQGGKPSGAIRAGDWKLIEWFGDGRSELYYLKDDIGERKELSAAHPEKAAQLRARLRA